MIITKLSSISNVERFYMEEDMKGREREKFIIDYECSTPHSTALTLLNSKMYIVLK